jgi:hypothetical protein
LSPITEFEKRQLNPMDFSLSVCTEVNLVVSFIAPSGNDAKSVTDPPVSMALSTLQWLECSKKNPQLTTTSGCSGNETCLLGNV